LTINVLIIDDHEMVAAGISQVLMGLDGIDSYTTARSLSEAKEIIAVEEFGLFLLDMNLPDGNGADLMPALKAAHPNARVIAVSGDINPSIISRLTREGADGVYDKGDSTEELTQIVLQVMAGGDQVLSSKASVVAALSDKYKLSKRQQEVLLYLNEGLTNKEISYREELSQATVAFHIAELKKKLGCDTTREIPRVARQLGILS
jgi:DNA-binding NarL/FixJ family response regulator